MRNVERVISRLFRCFGIRHSAFRIDAPGLFISLLVSASDLVARSRPRLWW